MCSNQATGNMTQRHLKDIEAFIFAFCLYIITPVFFVWHTKIATICTLVCVLLAIKNFSNQRAGFFNRYLFFMGFMISYCYFVLKTDTSTLWYIIMIASCFLFAVSKDFIANVFKKFTLIYSITLVPSIIVYLLINVFGLDLLITVIEPLNESKLYEYSVYPFLVQDNEYTSILLLKRFHGYYDEPGVVGTISAVLLISSGYNLKRLINVPIFIAGVLSFSLAFLIASVVYIVVFCPLKYKIFIVIFIFVSLSLSYNNDALDHHILKRVTFEEGRMVGDNRTIPGFDEWYEKFKESDKFYCGIGWQNAKDMNRGGSSYKELIVAYGIVAFIFYIGMIVLFALYHLKLRKDLFIYFYLFFLVIYQRPGVLVYIYMFLTFAPILFLAESSQYAKLKKQHYLPCQVGN